MTGTHLSHFRRGTMPAALRIGMCCGMLCCGLRDLLRAKITEKDVLRAMITDVLRVVDGF